jgi:hypothetical protein
MVVDDGGAVDPGYETADSGRRRLRLGSLHPAHSSSITIVPSISHIFTLTNMVKLKAVIDGLGLVSIALGMVPGVGENLKSAAELLSKICEQVQVRPSRLSDLNSF